MELKELNLNRYGYKNQPSTSDTVENSIYLSANINTSPVIRQNIVGPNQNKDAREIITGTVITACIIKSSDQDDRVEIGQNLEFVGGTSDVDYLAVFNDNVPVILMTKFGLTVNAVTVEGDLRVIDNFFLQGPFFYEDQEQSVNYYIRLVGASAFGPSTLTWTLNHIGTGKYQVVHNLGKLDYAPVVTPNNATVMHGVVSNITSTTFEIDIYNGANALTDSDWSCIILVSP